MAAIVKHKASGRRYALLGAGFGAFKASRPSVFFGALIPKEESGAMAMVCVCDARGRIGWFESEEVQVVEIDGRPIDAALSS